MPAIAIVPFFFAGSLFPITALPPWLADVARVLPLTHALALFRYGLTSTSGSQALHNIWGMSSAAAMAVLSLGVVALYAMVIFRCGDPAFHQVGKELRDPAGMETPGAPMMTMVSVRTPQPFGCPLQTGS